MKFGDLINGVMEGFDRIVFKGTLKPLAYAAGIESGLIGVYSCMESCHTFKAVFNKENSYLALRLVQSRCKYLYFYYDHKELGFMSVRLQTWTPFPSRSQLTEGSGCAASWTTGGFLISWKGINSCISMIMRWPRHY